jgi:hypothetical protein
MEENKKEINTRDVEKSSVQTQRSSSSLNLFGRPQTPLRKIRKQSKTFRYKLRIYCALHKPVGYAKYYHSLVIALIVFSCIVLNVFEGIFKGYTIDFMSSIDIALIGITSTHLSKT